MTFLQQDPRTCQWFSRLASALDRRSAARLAWLFLGAVLARGRRTVTSWIRAAGLSAQFQPCYTTVAAAGKKAVAISAQLVAMAIKPLLGDLSRILFAIDDTPTRRHNAMGRSSKELASTTIRRLDQPTRRMSMVMSGS